MLRNWKHDGRSGSAKVPTDNWLGSSLAKNGVDVAEDSGSFIGVEFHDLTNKHDR